MDYTVAKIVNTITIVAGYLTLIAGLIFALLALTENSVSWSFAIAGILSGISIAALGQMANATIETAEQTRATARATQKVLDILIQNTNEPQASNNKSRSKGSGAVATKNGIDLHRTGDTFVARGIVFNSIEQFYEWAESQ